MPTQLLVDEHTAWQAAIVAAPFPVPPATLVFGKAELHVYPLVHVAAAVTQTYIAIRL